MAEIGLMAPPPFIDDLEVPTCRVCGCTDLEACDGGCVWVEDPEGLDDLCSNCLEVAPTTVRGTQEQE